MLSRYAVPPTHPRPPESSPRPSGYAFASAAAHVSNNFARQLATCISESSITPHPPNLRWVFLCRLSPPAPPPYFEPLACPLGTRLPHAELERSTFSHPALRQHPIVHSYRRQFLALPRLPLGLSYATDLGQRPIATLLTRAATRCAALSPCHAQTLRVNNHYVCKRKKKFRSRQTSRGPDLVSTPGHSTLRKRIRIYKVSA
ncbi:hypothetical protein IWX49DRAFT_285682 [Phyllosticta citricarpa]